MLARNKVGKVGRCSHAPRVHLHGCGRQPVCVAGDSGAHACVGGGCKHRAGRPEAAGSRADWRPLLLCMSEARTSLEPEVTPPQVGTGPNCSASRHIPTHICTHAPPSPPPRAPPPTPCRWLASLVASGKAGDSASEALRAATLGSQDKAIEVREAAASVLAALIEVGARPGR